MKGEITKEMIRQHVVLNSMLENFEKSRSADKKKLKLEFYRFKWNLEKHIFIEEQVIFGAINLRNKRQINIMKELIQEHEEIKIILNGMIRKLIKGAKPETKMLKEIITGHENKEVNELYPKMDEDADEEVKLEILEKSKDILLK